MAKTKQRKIVLSLLIMVLAIFMAFGFLAFQKNAVMIGNAATTSTDQIWDVEEYFSAGSTGTAVLNGEVDDAEAYGGKAYKATLTGTAADTKGIKLTFGGEEGVDVSSYAHIFLRVKIINPVNLTNCTLRMGVNAEPVAGSQGYPYYDPVAAYSSDIYRHYISYDLKSMISGDVLKTVYLARTSQAITSGGQIEIYIDHVDFVEETLTLENVTGIVNNSQNKTYTLTEGEAYSQKDIIQTNNVNASRANWLGWDMDIYTGKYAFVGNFRQAINDALSNEMERALTLNFDNIDLTKYAHVYVKLKNYNTDPDQPASCTVTLNVNGTKWQNVPTTDWNKNDVVSGTMYTGYYEYDILSMAGCPETLTSLTLCRAGAVNGYQYGIMMYIESITFVKAYTATVIVNGVQETIKFPAEEGFTPDTPTVDGKVFVGWSWNGALYSAGATLPITQSGDTVTALFAEFTVPDVASARIAEVSGLRFTTYIDASTYMMLQDSGLTYNIYTLITSINSNKFVKINIDLDKIYHEDGVYCFNSVIGSIKAENYTRVFYADSYIEIEYANGTSTIQALTSEDREGRSYAQIINAAINDVSDTETETAKYYWNGQYHGLSQTMHTQAMDIYTTITNTKIVPIIIYDESAEAYKDLIQGYFDGKDLRIGSILELNDLIEKLSLPENETLDITGEGANGVVTNRGLNLTIAVREKGTIIDNGSSEYVIVYGDDVTSYCASDLQGEMSKAMATSYAMSYQKDDGTTNKSKVISIGSTAYAKEAGISSPEDIGITMDDGFAILSHGDNYIIYGGSNEGNLYGVYEFLRQIFGVEYLAQGGQRYYPSNASVIAEPIYVLSNPSFDTRDYYSYITWGWNSEAAHFGFNSPETLSDGRVSGTVDNTYGSKYFNYYYGEETDSYYTGQVTTSHTTAIGHTVQELLAYSAAKEKGFDYGTKTSLAGGEQWLKGWEEYYPQWYAYDPNYLTRIQARNNVATDISIDVSNTPQQVETRQYTGTAYISSKRANYQRAMLEICWTNGLNSDFTYTAGSTAASGSVIEKLVSLCLEMIRDPKNSEAVYLELGFADYYVECQCANCLAAYKKFGGKEYTYSGGTSYWGGFGGTVANTVNEIAKAVKAEMQADEVLKDREVKFITLGYQRAISAPVDANGNALLDLDEDVIVRLCWRNCASHAINDVNCSYNQQKLQEVEAWKKVANELAMWDYTVNFKDYLYYIHNYDAIKTNYQYYKDIGVTQLMTQGAPGEWYFYENTLHQYVISKLMWNVELDVDTIINSFDNMYFGQYASYVSTYRTSMNAMYEQNDIHANTWGALDFANSSKFDAITLKTVISNLQNAINAATAAGDTEYAERLSSVIITPQYMLLDMNLISSTEYDAMLESFKSNVELLGLTYYAEGSNTFADKFGWTE